MTKISRKGLNCISGTLDKLELIPRFINLVKKIGMKIIDQTNNIVLINKKLYALKDVITSTNSLLLIVVLVIPKKLVIDLDFILLDFILLDFGIVNSQHFFFNNTRAK